MKPALARTWTVLACLALLATACGNRLSRDQILAQNVVQTGGGTSTGAQASAGNATEQGTQTGPGATLPGVGNTETTLGAAQPGATGPGAITTPDGSPVTGNQVSSGPANKAPIIVGFIGYLSGLGGASLSPARDAWVAWARAVNASGGINGHPVDLLIGDDGGNASVSISIARDFVENKGAIALTYAGSDIPFASYADSKSVPVIGSIPASDIWNQNPMLFPAFPAPEATSWGAAHLMKMAGLTKVAFLYCAESEDCQTGKTRFEQYVGPEGLQLVYVGEYSVTQPDFTAECLQMKSAGAQAVLPIGDTSSMIRMAESCGRQGFRPVWVTPSAEDAMTSVPELEGTIGVTGGFPWFLRSGAPGVTAYASALAEYAPNGLTNGDSYQAWGWQSALLFQEAAASVGAKPTSRDILNGLWAMHGNTIDGLAPGPMARTFSQGKPTPEVYCVFSTKIENGRWVAPQGLTPVCR